MLIFFGSIGWIVLGWPLPLRLWIALDLIAGCSFAALIWLFIKQDLPVRGMRALAGGTGLVLLIAAVMAVPALQDAAGDTATKGAPASQPSGNGVPAATPSVSTTPVEDDPLTATLDFNDPSWGCENYTIPRSFLPSLPKIDTGYAPKWIYEHGGATLGAPLLIVEGKSQDAVVLKRIRLVDVHRNALPASAIGVLSCGPVGGVLVSRHLELNMDNPAVVKSRRGEVDPDGTRQSAYKFPFKVSNSDPETFALGFAGSPCLCDWRLAIDWTSGGRSGTTIVGRSFGSVSSDTLDHRQRKLYYLYDGKWLHT